MGIGRIRRVFVVAVVAGTFAACRPAANSTTSCYESNTDPILAKGEVQSEEYRNTMLAYLESYGDKTRYYFEERNEKNELVVKAEGPDFCGFMLVEVTQEDAMSTKLQNNKGYSSAELLGLHYRMEDNRAYWLEVEAIVD